MKAKIIYLLYKNKNNSEINLKDSFYQFKLLNKEEIENFN